METVTSNGRGLVCLLSNTATRCAQTRKTNPTERPTAHPSVLNPFPRKGVATYPFDRGHKVSAACVFQVENDNLLSVRDGWSVLWNCMEYARALPNHELGKIRLFWELGDLGACVWFPGLSHTCRHYAQGGGPWDLERFSPDWLFALLPFHLLHFLCSLICLLSRWIPEREARAAHWWSFNKPVSISAPACSYFPLWETV